MMVDGHLLAAIASTSIWTSHTMSMLDQIVISRNHSSSLIALDWEKFEYVEGDPDHFTWKGFDLFCGNLSSKLAPYAQKIGKLLVLTDSTVGYLGDDGARHLATTLRNVGIPSVVDAVNGSGFVARSDEGLHFRQRLSHQFTSNHFDSVLLIGGWNDEGRPHRRVGSAAEAFWALAEACIDKQRARGTRTIHNATWQ